jgi:hypothetical protein
MRPASLFLCGIVLLTSTLPAMAIDSVTREQEIVELRLGQRIYVDDGSCPRGQIKLVTGSTLSTSGVTRARACVPRMGSKSKMQ